MTVCRITSRTPFRTVAATTSWLSCAGASAHPSEPCFRRRNCMKFHTTYQRRLASGMKRRTALAALAATVLCASSAFAQDFPSKPIRLIVGYASGGGVDYTARVIAPRLGEALNTTVVVENRAGAS